jgi:hypothetical protein
MTHIKVIDHLARIGQLQQLHSVDAVGVVQHTGAIDNRNGFVGGDFDLIGAQITIWTPRLKFRDLEIGFLKQTRKQHNKQQTKQAIPRSPSTSTPPAPPPHTDVLIVWSFHTDHVEYHP